MIEPAGIPSPISALTATFHMIEAALVLDKQDKSSDIPVDLEYTYRHVPGCEPEIDIVDVMPFGCVPPYDPDLLMELAREWMDHGGWYSCRELAEEERAV